MSITDRLMESRLMQRTVLAWRWWVLVGQVASAALTSGSIVVLAIFNARCPTSKAEFYPSEPYTLMVTWEVLPWIAAAVIQMMFLARPSLPLDIWRVLTLLPMYVGAFIVNIPFLEEYWPRAMDSGPGCPMSSDEYFTMHELYENLGRIGPPFLLVATLVMSFIIAGCVWVVSRLSVRLGFPTEKINRE